MNDKIRKLIVALLFLFSLSTANAKNEKIKILFIGNSYTYFNGLPSIISNMALRESKEVVVSQITQGGFLLSEYLKKDFVIEDIKDENYDFVILQEQSTAPLFKARELTYPAIREFNKLVKNNGGETILFMTWAREYVDSIKTKMLPGKFYYDVFDSYNTAQDSLAASYCRIGKELDVAVAPAGLVWKEIHNKYPDLKLWRNDHNHPMECGSIIAAYSIYATLFGSNIENVRSGVPVERWLENDIKSILSEMMK